MNELSGRIAVVTGGAAGLGRGVAERFVGAGARVVIADVDQVAGEGTAAALGDAVVFRRTDVAEPDQVRDLVQSTVDTFGGVDVMVNNAGVSGTMHARFLDEDFTDFSEVMSVNLLGVMAGTQQAARHMVERGGGSIINVTSIGGIAAGRSVISYRASKAGVIQMSKSVAIDLAEHGVRVNCIAPGNIPTGLLAGAMADGDADGRAAVIRSVMGVSRPLKREGAASDVAEAALYLAGDGSAYVTGVVLPVDGGTTAGTPFKSEDLIKLATAETVP
ncbi:SDR family oxidoreductase [Saccharopolyspora sp. HNM0983]|uniref:SDR family oxidoreductase n=1 Tax=Saccharopolyspora montiporae TaxID=2781240 RepID=A0A929B7Z7_9PSEU|nr:SDR family oxidoreductase [Saccharopolyspora sp. HNM0983]